jgi:DUF1365 family protein
VGEVVHQRFEPVGHRLRYRMFQMLLDLDEAPGLGQSMRLFSYNRAGVFSFHEMDHGDRSGQPLRAYVERHLSQAGIPVESGRILLLCMPRLFGHVFNPLSIYYCYRPDSSLAAVLYEVNNTFGDRHSYLISADERADGSVRQSCEKNLFVSPFMDMTMRYDFKLTRPGSRISTVVNGAGPEGGKLIFAAFTGERRGFADRTLLGLLVTYPFQTLGVVAAIHWEALKLYLKGVRLRPRPKPPAHPVSTVG